MRKRQHIFLKSALRQPVRTVLLLLLVGVVAFAFTVRVLECALIYRETDRVGESYRAAGTLHYINKEPDYEGVAQYLENDRNVQVIQRPTLTSAVLEDGKYNADGGIATAMAPFWGNLDGAYGLWATYPTNTLSLPGDYAPFQSLGDPKTANPADVIFYGTLEGASGYMYGPYFTVRVDEVLVGHPRFTSFRGYAHMLYVAESTNLPDWVSFGQRYLFRGTYDPTYGGNGVQLEFVQVPLWTGGPMYLEASQDLNLKDPVYGTLAREMQLVSENLRAVSVILSEDFNARSFIQAKDSDYFLESGRWPNWEDNEQKRPVCALSRQLAASLGVRVGDHVTMTFRNINSYSCYLCFRDDIDRYEDIPTSTVTFEVVGLWGVANPNESYYANTAMIPASFYPEDFRYTLPSEGVPTEFVLSSPAVADKFLLESQAPLAELGCRVIMLENGWQDFAAATGAMCRTALYNAILFSVVLAIALVLVCFVYFRFRRRDLAISRALGVPMGRCVWGSALPMMLLGLAGAGAGGAIGARYVSANITDLLKVLYRFQTTAEPAQVPFSWVVLLILGIAVFTAVLALLFALVSARKPLLTLLHGEGQGHRKRRRVPAASPSMAKGAPAPTAAAPSPAPVRSNIVPTFTKTNRGKSKGRRAIVILLTVLGVIFAATAGICGYSAKQLGPRIVAAQLECSVSGRLVEAAGEGASVEGFVSPKVAGKLEQLAALRDVYLEAAFLTEDVSFVPELDVHVEGVVLRGFTDLDGFLARREGEYTLSRPLGPMFANEFGWAALYPKQLYEDGKVAVRGYTSVTLGDRVEMPVRQTGALGTYEGPDIGLWMPLNSMKRALGDALRYNVFEFSVDPVWNGNLDGIRDEIESLLEDGIALELDDSQIQARVTPLQRRQVTLNGIFLTAIVLAAVSILAALMLLGGKDTGRFVSRHIVRSPLKSLLALVLLAAFSLVGVLIQTAVVQNERRVEELYATVPIVGEVIGRSPGASAPRDALINYRTVQKLLGSGYVKDSYREGAGEVVVATTNTKYLDILIVQNADRVVSKEQREQQEKALATKMEVEGWRYASGVQVRGFPQDFDAFLANYPAAEIEYLGGWKESTATASRDCVILSRNIYEELKLEEGNNVAFWIEMNYSQRKYILRVAGILSEPNQVWLPVEGMEDMWASTTAYRTFSFSLDPTLNRDVSAFQELADEVVADPFAGAVKLQTVLWDQQLRQSVEPLEQVLDFMRVLYPVVIALSTLLSAGMAALLVLMSAKDAAILRVLGGTKAKARLTIALEVLIPCVVGLVLGHIAGRVMAYRTVGSAAELFMTEAVSCAGLYLGAGIAGAVIGAILMTRKNPLELLQVKE